MVDIKRDIALKGLYFFGDAEQKVVKDRKAFFLN